MSKETDRLFEQIQIGHQRFGDCPPSAYRPLLPRRPTLAELRNMEIHALREKVRELERENAQLQRMNNVYRDSIIEMVYGEPPP